jgi:SnoaL-like domain
MTASMLEELAACRAIRDVKARYCNLFDNRRFVEWGALFTDDAVIDMTDDMPESEGGVLRGGGNIFAVRIPELLGSPRTLHQVSEPVITFSGPTAASVIWPMQDLVIWPAGAGGPMEGRRLHGYGWYHEQYVRSEQVWRIAHLKLVRRQLDFTAI